MTSDQVLSQLEAWGSEKAREINARHGAGENQFGVNRSNIRALAKQIKSNHELGLELWQTGNVEAMLLATLILKGKQLSEAELDEMAHQISYFQITDWLLTNIVKSSRHKDALRPKWVESDRECVARAGWSLLAEKVSAGPDCGLDIEPILVTIEAKLRDAPLRTQETMNYCLVQIAVNFPEQRQRCLDMAERLAVFKDYPVSKGCTSPYAPEWIALLLGQKG